MQGKLMERYNNLNWQELLKPYDMVFKTMPVSWEEAPYLGNGNMGAMLYQSAPSAIRLQIFRSDVHDHRDNTHGWTAYSRPRFMLGWFELKTCGEITGCDMRLDLWNAELAGSIVTSQGEIGIHLLVHSLDMAFLCTTTPNAGEDTCAWSFSPGEASTTRPGYPTTPDERKEFADRYGDQYLNILTSTYFYFPEGLLELTFINNPFIIRSNPI
jgi:alpha-L-fucosidase 2